jgi:hypothetical protein
VGQGSAGEPTRAREIYGELGDRERRGLERCRSALERGRRVRGRPIASSEQHGLLVDLRGAVGHVPAGDMATRPRRRSVWRGGERHWDGWVVVVHDDLVHLAARPPGDEGDEAPVREAEILSAARSGAVVRLDDGSIGLVPLDELSWEPSLGVPALDRGTKLRGRIVALTLEGPVLSPRAVAPSPWPAIALAYPPGTEVAAVVEQRTGSRVLLRTDRAPRAPAVVDAEALPGDPDPGARFEATVTRVNAIAGAVVLERLRSPARALRPAPEAPTQERREPRRAASDSRS